jgi:hypothetical protein
MNQLNNMQKNYLKQIMDMIIDYKNFESLPVESAIALSVMNESALSIKELEKSVNSFMQVYGIQKEWNAKKLQSAK